MLLFDASKSRWNLLNGTFKFSSDIWDNKFEAALMRSLSTNSLFFQDSVDLLDLLPSLQFRWFDKWRNFDSRFDYYFYTYLE